ncbi:MAG: sulfotransferase domain-containing protein [Desulfobacterales bacterium]|nr:sulfotransferase domain-containing protein [Desulfobacterales bacterium]
MKPFLTQLNYNFSILKKTVNRVAKNPKFIIELAIFIKNDFLSIFGCYHYSHNILFITGAPKSGTTWVQTQLARVPGYNIRPIRDPDGCTKNQGICSEVFRTMPSKRYSVLKLHTRYNTNNYLVISNHVNKFIVMIRDVRDICVSRYFHVKADENHRHHKLYNHIPKEMGILHSMNQMQEAFIDWIGNWASFIGDSKSDILLIRYEDINRDPYSEFLRILLFFDIQVPPSLLYDMASSKLKKETDLNKVVQSNLGGRMKSTARKGIIGDWRNHFTPAHKKKMKVIAGELLIQLGYETSNDW